MTRSEYVRQVGSALRDVPWRTRRELLADLTAHLVELPDDTDLVTRLGTPAEYAADLRAAAGLARRRGLISFFRARRPRNLVITALSLAVIGLGIGAVAWVNSDQPVAYGQVWVPPVRKPGGALGLLDSFGGSMNVHFRPGRPFHLGVAIENTGPFAVRILGVPYDDSKVPWSAHLQLGFGVAGPYTPFHPFDLEPHERQLLFLNGVYACKPGMRSKTRPGGAVTKLILLGFPVRFSFLWRTATAEIPLPQKLQFDLAKACLVRGARHPKP